MTFSGGQSGADAARTIRTTAENETRPRKKEKVEATQKSGIKTKLN